MKFTKFPKMENLQTAMAAGTPDFLAAKELSTKWVVTEKIDGTNISMNINRDAEFSFGCRNSLLADDEEFYNVHQSFNLIKELAEDLCATLQLSDFTQVSIYGEFFGQKVMNRLHYGMDSKFRFYTALLYLGDEARWVRWSTFHAIMGLNGAYDLIVPVLADDLTFEEACAFANDQKSRLCDDTMEGVVIWPKDCRAFENGHVYAFKNKNEAFLESSARKIHTPLTESEKEADALNALFREYCTESRMWSVFSKLGKPKEGNDDAGKYIVAFTNDAWEDFVADHPEAAMFDKAGISRIRKVGGLPYTLFKTVQVKNETA